MEDVAKEMSKTFSFTSQQQDKLKNYTFENKYTRSVAYYIYHWLDAGQTENN